MGFTNWLVATHAYEKWNKEEQLLPVACELAHITHPSGSNKIMKEKRVKLLRMQKTMATRRQNTVKLVVAGVHEIIP